MPYPLLEALISHTHWCWTSVFCSTSLGTLRSSIVFNGAYLQGSMCIGSQIPNCSLLQCPQLKPGFSHHAREAQPSSWAKAASPSCDFPPKLLLNTVKREDLGKAFCHWAFTSLYAVLQWFSNWWVTTTGIGKGWFPVKGMDQKWAVTQDHAAAMQGSVFSRLPSLSGYLFSSRNQMWVFCF